MHKLRQHLGKIIKFKNKDDKMINSIILIEMHVFGWLVCCMLVVFLSVFLSIIAIIVIVVDNAIHTEKNNIIILVLQSTEN